jgi:hypothetical protein
LRGDLIEICLRSNPKFRAQRRGHHRLSQADMEGERAGLGVQAALAVWSEAGRSKGAGR